MKFEKVWVGEVEGSISCCHFFLFFSFIFCFALSSFSDFRPFVFCYEIFLGMCWINLEELGVAEVWCCLEGKGMGFEGSLGRGHKRGRERKEQMWLWVDLLLVAVIGWEWEPIWSKCSSTESQPSRVGCSHVLFFSVITGQR